MKKRSLILVIIAFLVLTFALAGCSNSLKKGQDYYRYSFEFEKGEFVKNKGHISFSGKSYKIYDNTGAITSTGDYFVEDSIITFVPDNLGANTNRMLASFSNVIYKSYIIDTVFATRMSFTTFGEKEEIEGLYSNGLYLKDGAIYQSTDGSNTLNSFTEQIGEYSKNKKDFYTLEIYGFGKDCVLHYITYDAFGQKTSAFAATFYATKQPKISKIKDIQVDFYTQIFASKSKNNSIEAYELQLITYPDKSTFNGADVVFEIDEPAPPVGTSISGNTLFFQDSGAVWVKYTYKNHTASALIRIVSLDLIPNLTNDDKTLNVGDVVDFDDLVLALATTTFPFMANYSVSFAPTSIAEAKEQSVSFLKAGQLEVNLEVRYVVNYIDGDQTVVTLTESVILTIVE